MSMTLLMDDYCMSSAGQAKPIILQGFRTEGTDSACTVEHTFSHR